MGFPFLYRSLSDMEARQAIKNLITPEFLRTHKKYSVLVEAIAEELGRTSDCIELIPILGAPELMPDRYLPVLCDMLGIDYNYDEHVEAHRELVKRVFEALKARGCNDSLLKAVRRGNDTEFFIEDLSYYNRKMREQYANIWPAYERIFRYSVSRASGTHHIEDGKQWDMGFLIVECENTSDLFFKKVYSVLPAGRQLLIWMYVTLVGQGVIRVSDFLSWDPDTGLPVIKNIWETEGGYGEVTRPTAVPGYHHRTIMDMGLPDLTAYCMRYSRYGKLSGALRGQGDDHSCLPMSGQRTGTKDHFVQIADIFAPSVLAGWADVLVPGSLGDPQVLRTYDGFFFDPELQFAVWNGAFAKDMDGGSFGESRAGAITVDGSRYKS